MKRIISCVFLIGLTLLLSGHSEFSQKGRKNYSMSCERVSLDTSGFVNRQAAASWYPKKLKIYVYVHAAYINSHEAIITVNKPNGRFSAQSKFYTKSGERILKFDRFITGKSYLKLQKVGGYKDAGRAQYKCINDVRFNEGGHVNDLSYATTIKMQNEDAEAVVNYETGAINVTSTTSYFKELKRLMKYNPDGIKIGVLGFDDKPNGEHYWIDDFNLVPTERRIQIKGEHIIIKMDPQELRTLVPASRWYLIRLEEEGTERYSWHRMWFVE